MYTFQGFEQIKSKLMNDSVNGSCTHPWLEKPDTGIKSLYNWLSPK